MIDDRPMIWKEVFADRGPRWPWFARLIVLLLVLASFMPVVSIGWDFFSGALVSTYSYGYDPDHWKVLAEETRTWVVVFGHRRRLPAGDGGGRAGGRLGQPGGASGRRSTVC